jgi:hypothetical protein
MLFLQRCTGDVTPVKTIKEQVFKVDTIDRDNSHLIDSFNRVIDKKDSKIAKGNSDYDDLKAEYLNYQNDIEDSLKHRYIPDSCKLLVADLKSQFNKLKGASDKKDNLSKEIINDLREQTNTQKSFLVSKDTLYKRLHNSFDTCIAQQKTLERVNKSLQPRRSISAGIITEIGYASPYRFDAGVSFYLNTKKGSSIGVGILTNQRIQISVSKQLFKF